ncbi:MAG: ThiF family adenylyltransferase [Nitrososphaerota archaeon]
MDTEIQERYDRQARTPGWDQSSVQNGAVAIVGVGALGCEVAKNLALMGIGKLVLIDNDVVELSNLSRQMLFTENDIGKPKSEVAAQKIKSMNRFVDVVYYNSDVRQLPEKVFEDSDVVCSCLDSWGVRRWLNSLCVSLGKPMVDGSIEGFYGNVQVVIPGRTACLECHGENLISREERLAECTLRRRSPDELVKDLMEQGIVISREVAEELFRLNIKTIYDLKYSKLENIINELAPELSKLILEVRDRLKPKSPAIQSVSATIAGLMTTQVIKLLHKGRLGEPDTGLFVYDALHSRLTRVKLARMKECIVCGDVEEQVQSINAHPDWTIQTLKEIIALRYSFPDPEILHGTKRLNDDQKLIDAGIRDEDIIYISTSRRHMPLPLKMKLTDTPQK